MRFSPVSVLTSALAVALLAGCSGTSQVGSTSAAPGALPQSVAIGDDAVAMKTQKTFTVGLKINFEKPYNDPTYGAIFGIIKGDTAKKTHVITIKVGDAVVFTNQESHPHNGANLGDASKNGAQWPSSFDGGSTASPAGTDISTAGFSSGTLQQGQTSAIYAANVPGFYMFGCGVHYNSQGQRNIIIVK